MGGSVAMEYSAKVTTNAAGDPGDGNVVWNTAAQNTATHIFIDQVTVAKTDVGILWREAQPRPLLIQRKTNTAVFANYTITAVVDNGGWFDLAVVPGSNAGLPFSGNDTLVVVLGPKPIA
jgi:predicted GTPase